MQTRRSFFGNSAAAATAASYGRIPGANGRPRFGLIGAGNRGLYLLRQMRENLDADFPAVCDVWDVRSNAAATYAGLLGLRTRRYSDYRQVLAHREIDGVVVATPDHWHAGIAIDACKAGKDVYVEKPMVHHPRDGQALVKAARENRRIVQVGTQGRSLRQVIDAREQYVRPGVMGRVGLARAAWTSNPGFIQTAPPGMERQPPGLDWERWLGPQPRIPWNPDVYFNPHKWLRYNGGMIMGLAVHLVDTVHSVLGLSHPAAAIAGGGIHYYKDGRDTPDTVAFILEYPEGVTVTFTAEVLTAPGLRSSASVELYGTGGRLTLRYTSRGAFEYTPNARFSKSVAARRDGDEPAPAAMLKNWVECMRSRRKPLADEEAGYWSSLACYMAAEAFRTGSRVVWDPGWDLPARAATA